ncbi:restriction endonuclease [Bacillus sp. FJAT-29953]|nr:restriction endonuclease [Bacillus sp. FJAT-29953]
MEIRTGEKEVTKRKKAIIKSIIYFILLFYYLSNVLLNRLDWIHLLSALITPFIFTSIIGLFIPVKKVANNTKKGSKITYINKINNDTELFKATIDSLSGSEFERLIYLYFKDLGFSPELIGGSGDHGVDIVMKDPRNGVKIAVQCKRWAKENSVGNADIIKLNGGKEFYGCSDTLFITTSYYTPKAKEFAEMCNMKVWNRLHVNDKVGKWKKEKFKKLS